MDLSHLENNNEGNRVQLGSRMRPDISTSILRNKDKKPEDKPPRSQFSSPTLRDRCMDAEERCIIVVTFLARAVFV